MSGSWHETGLEMDTRLTNEQTSGMVAHALNLLREELQNTSESEGQIVALGPLRGETPREHWNGAISLEQRLDSGELSAEDVKAAHERVAKFFVPVTYGAPKRCGDGRTIDGYNISSSLWFKRGLGPQILGGTGGDATGVRLSKGYEPGATFTGDVSRTAVDHRSKFAPGDHTDDHAEGEKTGCGAIDGQVRKNEIHTDPERSKTVESVVKFIYKTADLPLPLDLFQELKANAQSINEHATEYFANKHKALDEISAVSPKGIEPLVGTHNEISLTLNFVDGTTFDRDAYNAQTDGKIQNFNIDVWAILQEHGENAGFVLADMVATALDLTDGSIDVFARVPQEFDPLGQVA